MTVGSALMPNLIAITAGLWMLLMVLKQPSIRDWAAAGGLLFAGCSAAMMFVPFLLGIPLSEEARQATVGMGTGIRVCLIAFVLVFFSLGYRRVLLMFATLLMGVGWLVAGLT